MYNSQYQLLPLTNQLVTKHPDEGRKLFERHGYHIPHPRYRDYYNAMQAKPGFFDDLGSLLGGLFGGVSKALSTQNQSSQYQLNPSYTRSASSLSTGSSLNDVSVSGKGASDLASMSLGTTVSGYNGQVGFNPEMVGKGRSGIPGKVKTKYGQPYNWKVGYNPAHKAREYALLLEHLRVMSVREQYPLYALEYVPNGTVEASYQPTTDTSSPGANYDNSGTGDVPVDDDTIFGINKKIAIGVGIVIVLVLYFQFRK